ncbi:MAG: DegT/DnrJ/EryC1/StrS aminotransferase family protein, partial [Patescibacteria group bacterium]
MKYIPVAKPSIDLTEEKNIIACVKSTWISSTGKYISDFESTFASLVGVKYAISCSNGTAALHLALLSLNIGPGDEVIVPALTFIATANVVKYVGATPVLVDVLPDTWTIDPQLVEKRVSPKTRAIIPVHLYGYPSDMTPLQKIASRNNIALIEDAAEAHEATYKRKKVGSIGDLGCFSFFGNKIITTGEGGMISTNDSNIKNKIELLKNHGMSKTRKYFHPILGYNYRMTNLQAAIGTAQL